MVVVTLVEAREAEGPDGLNTRVLLEVSSLTRVSI